MTYAVPAALAISPLLLTQCKDQPYAQHSTSLSPTAHLCIPLQAKLPPGANRILFVKNLNYQITGEDLYDLFGRYGSIRQIRIGNEPKSKGTAFVVYDDVMDVRGPPLLLLLLLPLISIFMTCERVKQAKNALEHLNGFHLQERYIVVLYHMPAKQDAAAAKAELARREEELAQLKTEHNINDDD